MEFYEGLKIECKKTLHPERFIAGNLYRVHRDKFGRIVITDETGLDWVDYMLVNLFVKTEECEFDSVKPLPENKYTIRAKNKDTVVIITKMLDGRHVVRWDKEIEIVESGSLRKIFEKITEDNGGRITKKVKK